MTPEQLKKLVEDERQNATVEQKVAIIDKTNDMKDKLDETHKDDTVFLVHDPKQLTAVGEANSTEVIASDYTVTIRVPKFLLPKGVEARPNGNGWYVFDITKENVFITPRQSVPLMEKLINIYAIRDKVNEIKEVEGLDMMTEDEANIANLKKMLELLTAESYAYLDTMYEVLGIFMDIPEDFRQFIEPTSAMNNFLALIANNPGAFNESETFTN